MDEEQEKWIKKLIEDTKEAGKLKPELTLKIIINTIQRKYTCSKDDAIEMCNKAM